MPVIDDVYPSRIDGRAQLIERVDPVVYRQTGRKGPFTAAEVDTYEEQGFLVKPSLFARNETVDLNEALASWISSPDLEGLEETITEPHSGAVRSIFRVHELHPLYRQLARDDRLLGAASQLLGSDAYIHQSRINLKPGFSGKEFYWHSDFETWHVEDGMPRMRALSVSLALTENFPFNGPLMVIPGSHRSYVVCLGATPHDHYKQSLKKQEYGVPDHDSLRMLTERGGIEAPTGPPGTAVFFDCNTMHGSNGNITPYPRSNVFFVYNSVENRLQDPFCGLTPRPEHIAARRAVEALQPLTR